MKHGKKFNHLGRTAPHRKAMFQNMAISIIENKRIFTTTAKGKAFKKFFEPIVTHSKKGTDHSVRMVFRYLQNKKAVAELFNIVTPKVNGRPGGYLRIIRLDQPRKGDNADMCMVELVDFNETYSSEDSKKISIKKSRRSAKKKKQEEYLKNTFDSVTELLHGIPKPLIEEGLNVNAQYRLDPRKLDLSNTEIDQAIESYYKDSHGSFSYQININIDAKNDQLIVGKHYNLTTSLEIEGSADSPDNILKYFAVRVQSFELEFEQTPVQFLDLS